MPTVTVSATTILGEFEHVQEQLVGKAVILTDGKAGTVERVWLDELPISTIKLAQTLKSP